ncbi:MAG TPA: FHA domain-containing protein [Phototrophicaceae bacterium]|nr:FHA domain-containing protein [Phototrophicaceae bacterium]
MMQGSDSFRLIVRRGPQPNQSYELNKDIVTLGRDITNDIVINDPEVSRHHMRLTRGAGGFTVEDLGSTNGTFVNGQRLTGARPLRPGDMIGLGETVTLAYEMAAAPSVASDVAPDQQGGTMVNAAQRGAQQYQQPAQQPQYNYQPQQPQQVSPYQPPSVQPQPQQSPYQSPSQQPSYQSPSQQSPYGQPQAPYSPVSPAPPAPGGLEGEYDPYAAREEEPRNTTRWILIGCAGLSLFCCCATVLGLVFIDQACLWDRIPVLYQVLQALGYTQVACGA